MKIRRVLIFSLMVLMFSEPSYSDEAVRIGIMRFNAKASGVSSRHTEAITDELTRALANSYSIAVVDRANFETIAREQRLSLSGLIDSRMAARIGRLAGIQYMIFGAVTRFGVSESVERSNNSSVVDTLGGLVKVNSRVTDPFKQEKARKTETAEVTLDASVVDVNTGEVVLAISETGTARQVISGQSSGRGLRESSSSSNISLQEEAISDAVARIGQRIKEAVVGEYPQVLSAEGRDIILGIGATSGVKAGNLYKISSEGAEIFDMQGNVVGRRVTPVAIVRVEDVQNNYSVARVVRDGGNPAAIRRGDRIEAVSQSEANELMRGNAFHRRRPPKPPMPREYASYREPVPVPEPEPEQRENFRDDYSPSRPRRDLNLENHSDKVEKVIASYGLSEDERDNLLERHKKAARMLSNEEKIERYSEMFRDNPDDYFAAYQAGKTAFNCGWYGDAKEWAEKSLAVNHRYAPAKRLLKAAESKL